MSSLLSAQAITAHIAITRMSTRRCRTLPRQRGSSTAPKCCTRVSIDITLSSIRRAGHHASAPDKREKFHALALVYPRPVPARGGGREEDHGQGWSDFRDKPL